MTARNFAIDYILRNARFLTHSRNRSIFITLPNGTRIVIDDVWGLDK